MKTGPYGVKGVWSNGVFQRYRDRVRQRQKQNIFSSTNKKKKVRVVNTDKQINTTYKGSADEGLPTATSYDV